MMFHIKLRLVILSVTVSVVKSFFTLRRHREYFFMSDIQKVNI